jgi:hypothetical protein
MKLGPILLVSAIGSGLLMVHPASGAPAERLPIPAGWKVDKLASGDLTGDGVNDTAVVIRRTDPKLIVKNEGLGEPQLDTNPRQLLVFEKAAKGYAQIAAATKLIPPAGSDANPCLTDPLDEGGISIARQVLSVNLHYWQSCGSWSVTSNTYGFKRQAGRFRLIGFDRMEFMRNSGEGQEISVNFLTGRKSTKPFSNEESRPKPARWSKIKPLQVFLDRLDLDACPKIDVQTYLC